MKKKQKEDTRTILKFLSELTKETEKLLSNEHNA